MAYANGAGFGASDAIFARGAILHGLDPTSLAKACPGSQIRSLPDGAFAYRQGSRCKFIYCVLQGQMKLVRLNVEGEELTTGMLSGGELFGPALGQADSSLARESAIARGPTAVWQVPAAEFRQLLLKNPEVALRVIEGLARRQHQMSRRLECFAFKRVDARLAETWRELSGGFEMRCEHGFGRHIRLTQQELADLVGASRPVISTLLNRLRKTGVLGYSRDYLCVRGIADIERLVDG